MTRSTVVFTCCGGAGGWSLLRSLAGTGRYRLVGCDADALIATLYQPELANCYVVPSGHDLAYIDRALDTCEAEAVDVLMAWHRREDSHFLGCGRESRGGRNDATLNDFVLLEVDPHYWGYSFLATAVGINFPDIIVRMMLGERG